jgi:signal transduction histidine kinase/ligand-binding sensor domain-containing protein/DNA-binding NarL/FixJ family response regulator
MDKYRHKKSFTTLFLVVVFLFFRGTILGIEIDRFEYLTTDDGLSQNTITSILCDSKGFMWFGTWIGLNKYDGYNFRVFQNDLSNPGMLPNNRIVSIWEDKKQFIWFETYDGYYHYFNPINEEFSTLPKYMVNLEEKYSKITCFFQFSEEEIWLGSSNSGVYRLLFDIKTGTYKQSQFLSRGQFSISNNDIRFIISDCNNNIYIGSKNGLNLLKRDDVEKGNFYFQHFFSDMNFTSAVASKNELWFGTESSGLVHYEIHSKTFYVYNTDNSPLKSNHIDVLKTSSEGNILIGSSFLYIIKQNEQSWMTVPVDGNRIDKIYEDYRGLLWVTTGKFGVQQIDQNTGHSRHFDLTPENYKYLSDKERPYFFEDSKKNFWICVHGGGLAQFQRDTETFRFFRNNPTDPKSISSNTVMCIAEDKTGTLWVGTSLQGGVNKIIFKNPAFNSVQTNKEYDDFTENIIRAVLEDRNGNVWIASKGGQIKIFDPFIQPVTQKLNYPFPSKGGLVYNVYSMFQDSHGYIWLGSKGAGIAVSTLPVTSLTADYNNISFYRYLNIENDSSSLCDNNIYCIDEDKQGKIWIGTYGGGICFTEPSDYSSLKFSNINSKNSNLSNDLIRNLRIDSGNNLWVATTFGLNRLKNSSLEKGLFNFETFYHDPTDQGSISYNDIVHIFEDSEHNFWFGTLGGGVEFLDHNKIDRKTFIHFSKFNGLSNNEVFGIVEDKLGHIWFSTENGLSRLDPKTQSFENFNKSNGLSSNEFSENTCLVTKRGKLIFGSSKGIEIVEPEKIIAQKYPLKVTFTNFQLFNKDANISSQGSPLTKAIAFTDKINLKYNQSSFSFEFSALNYLDKSKTQYAYFLENFDKGWNYVGTERKATYTNLKPGEYVFRVKAALWDGKWDNEETTIHVKISPPWWATTMAFIIYLVLFLAGSLFVSRIVLRINTFRNELKVEKAVNEVKLQFFTNVSHEIRTPLTLILGPIEDLLSDKKFPEEFKSTLTLMQKNGKRMLYLLNQLLDFRKVQNKKMILKVAQIDIVEFTQNIFDNFRPLAQHNGIEFSFMKDSYPEMIWADPHRIDSVIFNILSNAFKFTPRGKAVVVTISENSKAGEVYIKVNDGGPGLKSKDIPLLFNRYSILSGDTISNSTGIGLNLSNEIVKMHGGEIRVESEPGIGSEFTIVLKTGVAHFQNQSNILFSNEEGEYNNGLFKEIIPDESLMQNPDIPSITKHQHTILLVEDNLPILNYLSDILSVDFSIIKAKDGEEGLELALHYHPDLIISDIMMPVIDGIQMTRSLKENFDTCHIPVILLTAKSGIDDQILGIDSGAEAYVLKPFNMGLLKSIIVNMFEQRKLILKRYRDNKEISVSDIKITSRDQEFIDKLVKYIETNFMDQDLSISSLVDFSCVSRTVFYNKVKSLTGLSPIELMRQIKLKIAAQMLLNGYNVNEAAINIGFNDTRYFSKQFKELFGETPSNYKKSHLTAG